MSVTLTATTYPVINGQGRQLAFVADVPPNAALGTVIPRHGLDNGAGTLVSAAAPLPVADSALLVAIQALTAAIQGLTASTRTLTDPKTGLPITDPINHQTIGAI